MPFKQIIILILIMAVMVAGYFLLFPVKSVNQGANNGQKNNSSFDFNNVQVQIRDLTNVPGEYYSGNSRFSRGSCQIDTDCFVIGCSLEMCSSDKDLMTTCEIGGNFPDKTKYACGCVKDKCGWYFK